IRIPKLTTCARRVVEASARAISAHARDSEEIGTQALECRAALAEVRGLFVRELTQVASALRQKEYRAVRKSLAHPRPHAIGDNALQRGLAHAFLHTPVLVVDER